MLQSERGKRGNFHMELIATFAIYHPKPIDATGRTKDSCRLVPGDPSSLARAGAECHATSIDRLPLPSAQSSMD